VVRGEMKDKVKDLADQFLGLTRHPLVCLGVTIDDFESFVGADGESFVWLSFTFVYLPDDRADPNGKRVQRIVLEASTALVGGGLLATTVVREYEGAPRGDYAGVFDCRS